MVLECTWIGPVMMSFQCSLVDFQCCVMSYGVVELCQCGMNGCPFVVVW